MSAGIEIIDTPARFLVLVVDDEYGLLSALRAVFEAEFDVETASNAEEAELMLSSRSYDAIVCDHMLPGEQGLELLIRTSKRHPLTKRFLLTGYMNPELLSRATSLAGLSGCILKPVKYEELIRQVREALPSPPT
jgi:DNA-binding NtrC family response regulator